MTRPAAEPTGPAAEPAGATAEPTGATSLGPVTLAELFATAGESWDDHPATGEALVDGTERLSWSELTERTADAARAFIAAGLEPGDRVGIWAPNIAEWVIALGGLLSAGGVVVPINTRFKGTEAAYLLATSRARMVLAVDGFLGNDYLGMLSQQDLPTVTTTVALRSDDPPAGTVGWDGFLTAGEGVDDATVTARRDGIDPDDPADVMFTSGTTGNPKGVVQSHRTDLRAFAAWADAVGLAPGDRYLVVNPFFHTFGYKAGIVASLLRGATIVPQASFDAGEVMERIAAERISMLPGPPTLYQSILNHPDRAQMDASSLRLAVTGAAAIPTSLIAAMRDDLGFDTVVTGYGLTESCGIATMCRHDDDVETIARTSGRAIEGVEVAVVDDDGSEVGRGEPGEIVVRGYNVMDGYFEDPDQTAEAIDVRGWLHTGDIGVMDDAGDIRITDRKKDMFIVGGFNAYPAEIENLLVDHPAVAQAAVVGEPDERLGEVGKAFVVPAAGAHLDPDELIAWARETMANYKVPRSVELRDDLPLNASGKVLKYALRGEAP